MRRLCAVALVLVMAAAVLSGGAAAAQTGGRPPEYAEPASESSVAAEWVSSAPGV